MSPRHRPYHDIARAALAAVLLTLAAFVSPTLRPLAAQQAMAFDAASMATPLRFRYIGPVGNRVASVAGIPGDANTYYAGAASGGIWKTTDAGIHWSPIFDVAGRLVRRRARRRSIQPQHRLGWNR